MQFEYTDPQTEIERLIGGHYSINAFGRIEPGDDLKFRAFLESIAPPPRTTVYIDSAGGDVEAAINIGRMIREAWLSTSVGNYVLKGAAGDSVTVPREVLQGRCLSAATLIFIGGKLRYFPEGSTFGVHQFSFKDPSPAHLGPSQILSAKISGYIADMGVSSELLEVSSSVSGTDMKAIDVDQLKAWRVVTGGETHVSWSVQAQHGMIYVRGERDSLFGRHVVILGCTKSREFIFIAVAEAQGRERELVEFGLVEITYDGEKKAIDVSERCLRYPEEGNVKFIVRLSAVEARSLALSDGFGIRVRFTSEAPFFLGISDLSTEGARGQLETLVEVFGES